jgi:ABC-type hemin transport system substrate-binding protein
VAVFGADVAPLANHSPHQSEEKKLLLLLDDDAGYTSQANENTVATWLIKLLGVDLSQYYLSNQSVRGALIVAGPEGVGLTTDQLEALDHLTTTFPYISQNISTLLSLFP